MPCPTPMHIVASASLPPRSLSSSAAVLRELGISEDAAHINPNGGAIALGHPRGMSGARITGTAALELRERGAKLALATMCIGVGQGT